MKYLKKFERFVKITENWGGEENPRDEWRDFEEPEGEGAEEVEGELIHPLIEDGYLTDVNYLSLDKDGRIDEIGFKGEKIRKLSEDDGEKAYELNQKNSYVKWEFKNSEWRKK